MCVHCWASIRILEVVTDKDYAQYFLWNRTPFPFGEDVSPRVMHEAVRIATNAPPDPEET